MSLHIKTIGLEVFRDGELLDTRCSTAAAREIKVSAPCPDCEDTGIVFEHSPDCGGNAVTGDCCLYSERYCACPKGRELKKRES